MKKELIVFIIVLVLGFVFGWIGCDYFKQPDIIIKPGEPIVIDSTKYIPSDPITAVDTVYLDTLYINKEKIKWKTQYIPVYSLVDTTLTNTYNFDDLLANHEDILNVTIETIDSINVKVDTLLEKSFLNHSQKMRITNLFFKAKQIKVKKQQIVNTFQIYSDFNLNINNYQQKRNDNIIEKTQYIPNIGLNFIFRQKYKFNVNVHNNGFLVGCGIRIF